MDKILVTKKATAPATRAAMVALTTTAPATRAALVALTAMAPATKEATVVAFKSCQDLTPPLETSISRVGEQS